MININQLTEQLRMLPDQALQRMAMMYKQDPYIFPMVISEGMARKRLRMAGQGQAAQQQPKVADQAIQSLGSTPEEMGIAQLQAPNIQNMADGGIAGYDDMDYADSTEPVVMMAGGGVAGYAGQDESLVRLRNFDPLSQFLSEQGVRTPTGETYEERKVREQREKELAEAAEAEKRPFARMLKSTKMTADSKLRKLMYPTQEELQATMGGAAPAQSPPLSISTQPPALTGAPAQAIERAVGTRQVPPPAPPAPPAPSAVPRAPGAGTGAPTEGGIYSLAGRLFDPVEQETKRRLGRMQMDAQRRGDEELMEFEARKPKTKIGEGLEALLKKEEEGAKGERDEAKAMAIFNAGLAMMAGTSPRALENIAKGAMVGSGQYAEALKDFKKAAKERQKMLADIEMARRAEERDDAKTALSLMQRANDRQDKIEGMIIEAGTSLGIKRGEVAGRLYGTQMEQEGAMARTRAQDPLALYRALGDGNIKRGFEFAQTAKVEPMTKQKLFSEYMKNPLADPAKFGEYVQQYERQFGPLGGATGAASQSADRALVDKWLNPPR